MNRKHGQADSPLHFVWKAMRQRCSNPNNKNYANYGGRGIRVCEEWDSFAEFHAWAISHGYKAGLTLDRKNTDGDYSPSNCRFTGYSEQAQSRRKTSGRSSRFIGVSYNKARRKYVAFAKLNGKQKYLGLFETEEEAAEVRDVYVREHFNRFASLNKGKT